MNVERGKAFKKMQYKVQISQEFFITEVTRGQMKPPTFDGKIHWSWQQQIATDGQTETSFSTYFSP